MVVTVLLTRNWRLWLLRRGGLRCVTGRLTGGFQILAFLRWRFPAGAFEQRDSEATRDREVGGLVFSEDGKVDANDASRWSKQRRTRTTFSGACVVDDAPHVEIGDAALRRQRLNAFGFGEIT